MSLVRHVKFGCPENWSENRLKLTVLASSTACRGVLTSSDRCVSLQTTCVETSGVFNVKLVKDWLTTNQSYQICCISCCELNVFGLWAVWPGSGPVERSHRLWFTSEFHITGAWKSLKMNLVSSWGEIKFERWHESLLEKFWHFCYHIRIKVKDLLHIWFCLTYSEE